MPLSDPERTEIRALLEALQAKLESRIPGTEELSQPVQLDEPIGRLSRTLIDGPDFGNCQMCNRPTDVDRIRFQPEVLVCVRCA